MENTSSPDQSCTTAFELLVSLGLLMRDCHAESLAIQDALAELVPDQSKSLSYLETYQHLDRVTQVHEDVARLLPELARSLRCGDEPVTHLAKALRLYSLRDRLFNSSDPYVDAQATISGDVNFF